MIKNIKSETDYTSVNLIFKGSTNVESKGTYGLSHLMEHLLTHSYDKYLNVYKEDGILNNAYTSDNEIVFFIYGLDSYVKNHVEKYLDSLKEFKLTQELLDNEKKIVLEEYSDSFNDQIRSHLRNLTRKLLNSYSPIGLKEDIENITLKDCNDYFDKYLINPYQLINVSKHNEILKSNFEFNPIIENKILKFGQYDVPFELNTTFDKVSIINTSKIITEDFREVKFICDMLANGLESPIYDELREKNGLIYSNYLFLDKINEYQGMILFACQTSEKNTDKVQELLSMIFSNKEKYLTKDRFDIIKKYNLIKLKKLQIDIYKNVDYIIESDNWKYTEKFLNELNYEKILDSFNKYFIFDEWYKSLYNKEFKI